MIELLGQQLHNVVSLKDVAVRFNENPITFVRGMNLDADPADPTGNGAGKSLLLSCPANVFYFTPPLSLKKKAKKELLSKGSAITQHLKALDGCTYEVTQTASKYTIKRDGVDMETRTVPIAEKFIREKLFPISELVYYTTVYVSTQRPFVMQSSTDADRLTHLTDMFSLGDYDQIKKYFLAKLGEMRDHELKLQLLERDLLEANTKLKKLKRATGANKVNTTDLKTEREDLEAKIAKLVNAEFNGRLLVKELGTLLSVERELDALRSTYSSKMAPAAYASYLKDQRKLVRKQASYEEMMSSYRRTVRDTQKKLDELELPDKSQKKLESKLDACEKALDKLQDEQSELKNKRKAHDRLVEERDELLSDLKDNGYGKKKKPDMKADYSEAIAGCQTTLKLKRLLEHAHDDEAKCPTCLSDVDLDNVRTTVKSAEKRLPELIKARGIQVVYKEYLKAESAVENSAFDAERFAEVVTRIKAAGPIIEELKAGIRIWERHESYTRALASVKKPTAPEATPETDLTLEQLDDTIELCEDIIKHLASRDKLIENNSKLEGLRTVKLVKARTAEAEAELSSLKDVLGKRRKELASVVTRLDEANSAQHEHGVYITQKKKLVARIDELKPQLEDKRLVEVLVKAYSAKGVKTNVANDICSLLEQNLNTYSNLIFNEPFVFTVQATGTGMSMVVDRGNGHPPTDVRSLSGAESNAFRMLYVMSTLPLLPSDKRVNMLTLDEPCAHMDHISRAKFLNVFLPALAEIVPHIYVITPNHDDFCEGSSQWLVRKEKGKSTVLLNGVADEPTHNIADLVTKARKTARKAQAKRKSK